MLSICIFAMQWGVTWCNKNISYGPARNKKHELYSMELEALQTGLNPDLVLHQKKIIVTYLIEQVMFIWCNYQMREAKPAKWNQFSLQKINWKLMEPDRRCVHLWQPNVLYAGKNQIYLSIVCPDQMPVWISHIKEVITLPESSAHSRHAPLPAKNVNIKLWLSTPSQWMYCYSNLSIRR